MRNAFATSLIILLLLVIVSGSCSKNPSSSDSHGDKGKSNNGYFVIASPLAHDSLKIDSTFEILWIASNKVSDSAHVRISLFKDSLEVATIAASAPNNGAYPYAALNVGSGSGYRIKISMASDSTKYDFSGSFSVYSIFSGTITVAYPFAGAHLMMDSSDTIRWKTTGNTGPRIRLDLYCDTSFVFTIVQGMYTTLGKYPWNLINSPLGTQSRYRIKATSENDPGIFTYSGYFALVSKYSGGFKIVAPAKGAQWPSGHDYPILWDTTGYPGPAVALQLYIDSLMNLSITINTSNSGKYVWPIPSGMTTDSIYRVKIVSTRDAGFFAFSNPFTITGIATDHFEPDNNRTSAHVIGFNTVENHTITRNDTDWVKFTAMSGSSYIILSKGADQFQLQYALFLDSNVAFSSTSTSSANGALSWMWPCDKSGQYNARIVPAAAVSAGEYTFAILPFDSLTSIKFASPAAGSILVVNTATAISWVPDSILLGDTVSISLYKGSSRVSVLIAKLPSNIGTYAWSITDSFGTGDNYRIKIANLTQPSFCGYGPKFIISNIKPDDYEPDGSPEKASSAKLCEIQQHSITPNDTDHIRFPADSGRSYLLSLVGASRFQISGTLSLASSTTPAVTFSSNSGSQNNTVWGCAISDTAIAKITASSFGGTGAYSFKVSIFNPDTIVSFIAPTAALTWSVDSLDTIIWTCDTGLFGAFVALSLYSGQSQLCLISASTANNGRFSWKIPSGLVSGNNYRIKLAGLSNTALYGMSPVFTLKGTPGDAYEPDNSWQEAHGYTPGTTELHNITYNDTDWIKFHADSGSSYFLRVNGIDTFHTAVSFFYENVWSGADAYMTSNASGAIMALWTCAKSGTEYARINAPVSSLTATGAYSASLWKYDTLAIIAFSSPKAGDSYAAGGTILVAWTPDTTFIGAQVSVTLLKGSRAIVTQSWVDNAGKASINLPATSTISGNDYRIKIANTRYDNYFGYSPVFSVSGINAVPDEYEVDNAFGSAKTAVVGTIQRRNFVFNDTDWIQFSTIAGARYVLMTDCAPGNYMNAGVFYGSPAAVSGQFYYSGGSNSFRKLTPQMTGSPCFIELFPNGSNTYMDYTFKVIAYDSSVALRITSPSAGAVFRTGESALISWSGDTSVVGNAVRLDLFNGNTFVATYYSNNTGSFQWNASGVVSGSNYRFKISSNDTAIYAFSPIFSVVGVNGDSYEPDNSPAQASSIQLGTTQKRNIVLGDSDWIKIPAVSGSLYLFEYSCDASLELRAQLCDSGVLSGRYSTLTQDICLSDDSLVSGWICRTSGTYFISLTALSSSYTGNYTIRVSRFDTTVNAKISSPAAGAILSAGSFNTITWTPNAELFGSSVQITIYKGSIPVPPYISTQNTGTYSWLIPVYMENGNDYHIQISRNDSWGVQGSLSPAFSITGGLTADQYEPDNAMSKASVLTLGTTQRHTIPANDTDWVKFQADSGVAYSFIDSTTSLGLHVMLLNFGDGSYITSFDIASGQTTSAWTCPQTAVYASQITIKSSWAGNGTPGTYTTKFSKQ